MKTKTTVVIGAGIVGVSTAIWLQRNGHKVILIDKEGPAGGTSYGNGGVLVSSGVVPINSPGLIKNAPGMLLRGDSPLFVNWSYLPKMLPWLIRYTLRANADDARLVAKALKPLLHKSIDQHLALAKGTGAEKWISPSDYVFVYDNRAGFEKDAFAWSVRREMGFEWDELEGEEFSNYEPTFKGSDKFAIRLGGHGRVGDPEKYVIDLASHIEKEGGELIIAEVEDIIKENGNVTGVKTSNGIISCDSAVITAGVWSKKIAEKQGIKVPMESERGYHIDLINPSITPKASLMLTTGKFVIAPMEGRIRCAGIVEFGGIDTPASSAPIALLKRHITQTLPQLKYDRIEEWMGHRPAPVDSIPFIGPFDHVQGLYGAFGHHHVGLGAGARTGQLVADMVCGKDIDIDIKPYSLSRYSH